LAIMITSGILLNHWAQGHYYPMLGLKGNLYSKTSSTCLRSTCSFILA
jgi:hypothetical protein